MTEMNHTLRDIYRVLDIAPIPTIDTAMRLEGLTADSRKVKPGSVFVAERGVNVDGHTFIPKALEAGACAVVCEDMPAYAADHTNVAWLQVKDSAKALGQLASWWYGYPSSQLTLIGVTGTNGKTTIATLMYDMARLMGEKAGLISTVVNKVNDRSIPSTHTTPDTLTINALMRQMIDEGCTFCAMEVSSHACAQQRIAGLQFDGAVFTNLTRDHLDYHGTVDAYLRAKKSFFDGLSKDAFALTNIDDRNGQVMLQNTKASRYTYSIRTVADYHGHIIEDRIDGMLMSFDGTEVETHFVGAFNASNLTAVYGASLLCGWAREDVLRCISMLHPVDGRMQTLHGPDGITAIVDYAHTPDAIANVLDTITDVRTAGHVITVVGAGGDRDKGKRPLMTAEAMRRSDRVIITSDNPRHERPEDIAADMMAEVPADTDFDISVCLDRAEAITRAITEAEPGDIVLIAGKGHETYQIIGDVKHHFDDREVVKQAFDSRKK